MEDNFDIQLVTPTSIIAVRKETNKTWLSHLLSDLDLKEHIFTSRPSKKKTNNHSRPAMEWHLTTLDFESSPNQSISSFRPFISEEKRLRLRLFICCQDGCRRRQKLQVCWRHISGIKVNKDISSLPERQRRHFASEGASNRSLPHAAQEYFRILIAHLVCCCHMAFISIPSTQWGVKGPDAVSSSIPHIFLSFVSY